MIASCILVDIGSSSVKVYRLENQQLTTLLYQSIPFKKDFTPTEGISSENKEQLYKIINTLKKDNPDVPIHLYATALFRKMDQSALREFKRELKSKTDCDLTVISHDEENEYLEVALLDRVPTSQPIMIINIGGGSTEIVVVRNGKSKRFNIDLGVGSVNDEFPELNKAISGVLLETVVSKLKAKLPDIPVSADVAISTGGELTYMRLTHHPLKKNSVFEDPDHPVMINFPEFVDTNKYIFNNITLQELEALMPDNPTWMHGARGFSALEQAMVEKYGVKTLIPSDSNLINGIVRKNFS